MNQSANKLQQFPSFMPSLMLFHLAGMETMPCPKSFRWCKLCNLLWNSPKYIFKILLCFLLLSEALWCIFFMESKDELGSLIILILIASTNTVMFRSRKKIKVLLNKLSQVFSISHFTHRYKTLQLSILMYWIFMLIVDSIFLSMLLKLSTFHRLRIKNSHAIPDGLKDPLLVIRYISFVFTVVTLHCVTVSFTSYYCFICKCIKQLFYELESKLEVSIVDNNYKAFLQIYDEITQAMILADSFLGFPAFVIVLTSMFGLFCFGYAFAFSSTQSYIIYLFTITGVMHYFSTLLMVLLPGSVANEAAEMSKETIFSLPGWFPKNYLSVKMNVRQKFKKTFSMTLWKIYVIRKSLLISVLGTLVTYGFLVGTLGTVRNSDT
ncbi:hypothetical protein AVEN_109247-1 [Araneus ventricosus]|uniref:Gustatory receptor n=1 Tax=Araneus ventricosus TaxID=182803 RepID=A0A4Y2VDS2_ARAVE|nr:hypothetical protein AVEN_76286-1 [Araneus ventricosus]GBO22011.1 hypothetical protein AVEN_109247-1 [Araneus ventricosus]